MFHSRRDTPLWTRDLSRAKKRQGWERLCGEGQAEFFVLAAEASPLRQEDSGAGFTKTGLAQAAFERTARRARREWWPVQKRSVVLMQRPLRHSRPERRQPGARNNIVTSITSFYPPRITKIFIEPENDKMPLHIWLTFVTFARRSNETTDCHSIFALFRAGGAQSGYSLYLGRTASSKSFFRNSEGQLRTR